MPKLDLGDWKDESNGWIGFRLLATMTHPNDKQYRDEYLVWLIVCEIYLRRKAGWGEEEGLGVTRLNTEFESAGGLKRLLFAPSQRDVMNRAYLAQGKGELAGEIIYGILKFQNDPKAKNIGVNKVIKLIAAVNKDSPNKKERISVSTLFNYWEEFKKVSHLWCAFRILYDCKIKKVILNENIPQLLALSEEIRKFGEEYKWHSARPGLLPKGKLLTPPKGFSLPPAEIKTTKVQPRLIKHLKKI